MENAEKDKDALIDEISDASDEEFDDEGEVDEEDGKFERHVVSIPNIDSMQNEEEADRNLRLIDCAALFAGMEEEDEEDEDDNNNNVEPEEVVDGAQDAMEMENEIDGVPFDLKPGKGRKSLHAVIEAMQAKAGIKAQGYDESDGFIDDAEVEAESVAGMLETENKKPYRYDDFRVSVDFDVASRDKAGKGGASGPQSQQQKKRALKPLKDLTPPASDELKSAIAHFREVAKANSDQFAQAAEKKLFNLPEVLVAPLLRLAKAIQAWHPSKYLKEEIFEYVADVLPANIVNLKTKAKKLLGGTTPKINVPDSLSQAAHDGEEIDVDVEIEPSQPGTMSSAAAAAAAAPSSVTPKTGKKVSLDLQRLEDAKAAVLQSLARQQETIAKSTEKEVLRFKFDEDLLRDLEAIRSEAQSKGGKPAVTDFYSEMVAVFPANLMTNKRLGSVLTQFKNRKRNSANPSSTKKQKGETSVIDVDNIEGSAEESDPEPMPDNEKKRGMQN